MMFKDLGKSILIYGVASSIGKFVGLFFVPIYTRIFSPEVYGIIDIISVTIGLISILGILQLESAISRYYYSSKDEQERQERISTAFWTVIAISSILVVLLIGFSEILSNLLFNSAKYAIIISLASFILPLANIFSLYTVIIRFLDKPILYTLIVIAQLVVTVSASIILVVYLDKGIIGVFLGQILGLVVGVLLGTILLIDKIRLNWKWDYLKEMFRYSLPMVPGLIGGWLNVNAGRLVILSYLTLSEVGQYSVALKVASIVALLESAFGMAWGPFMWKNFEKPNHRHIYQRVMKIVSIFIFSIVALVALFGEQMVHLLSPVEYWGAGHLIGFIAFSIGLRIVGQTIRLGAGITKRTEYNTLTMFISVAVNIVLLIVLVPTFGIFGVPVSLFISTCVLIVIGWYVSERLYFIGFSKIYFGVAYVLTLSVVLFSAFSDINMFIKILISLVAIISLSAFPFIGRDPIFKLSSISIFGRK
jgi:O-antigen/teichoic acid export membrane protein